MQDFVEKWKKSKTEDVRNQSIFTGPSSNRKTRKRVVDCSQIAPLILKKMNIFPQTYAL